MKTIFRSLKKVLGPNLTNQVRPLGHGVKGILSNFWFGSPTHQFTLREVFGKLVDYPFFNPDIKLIGINGTKGKTSTTIFTAKLLNAAGIKTGFISTALIYDGEDEFLNPYKMGTIDSWKMNQLLDKMRYNRCDVIVLEMTSQGLEQNRHWGLNKFGTAVFLNAFPEHIEAHGSWEKYLQAKSKLFSHTKKGANIFINGETKQVENFNQITENVKTSLSDSWNLEKIVEGQDFEIIKNDNIYLSIKINEVIYPTKLVANFEALDLFFAWKVASLYSKNLLDSKVIAKIFSEVGNLPGRMEWVIKNGQQVYKSEINEDKSLTSKQKVDGDLSADSYTATSIESLTKNGEKSLENLSIIVDYAHEPESLKLVLNTFLEWKKQNRFDYIIHVLSCDGVGRDDWKKPILGDLSYEKADFTVLTTDNYGVDDDPNAIVKLLSQNYDVNLNGTKFVSDINRFHAFKLALNQAQKVALTGKKVLVFSTGVGTEFGLTQPTGILEWDERQKWLKAYE